jgi:hypothetical protein
MRDGALTNTVGLDIEATRRAHVLQCCLEASTLRVRLCSAKETASNNRTTDSLESVAATLHPSSLTLGLRGSSFCHLLVGVCRTGGIVTGSSMARSLPDRAH